MAETERSKEIGTLKDKAKTGPPDTRIRACRRLLAMNPGRPTRDYVRAVLRQLADMPDVADKANELLRQSGKASGARKITQRGSNQAGEGNQGTLAEVPDEVRKLPTGPRLRALYDRESKRPGFADSLRLALEALRADRDAAFQEIIAALDGKPTTLQNVEAVEAGLSDGARQLVAEFRHDLMWAAAVKKQPAECPYCSGPVRWLPGFGCWECSRCSESKSHYFPKESRPETGRELKRRNQG